MRLSPWVRLSRTEGKVDYIMAVTGTTYDVYPLDTSLGGYIFGKDDNGNWNPQDLGVDSEGMIEGHPVAG